ncbi:MAG: hypothetical protein EBR07_11715, partial [Planctomycetes bacterium]|nr:hypothetical protein [Planctomycetota bacterium]
YTDTAKRGLKLEAVRMVTANPSTKPFIRIIRPTELGSDGKPTEIILPDGPGPDSLDYVVQVETSVGVTTAPTLTGITTTETPSVSESTSAKTWTYNWHITAPGTYTIAAETSLNGQTTATSRGARVILRHRWTEANLRSYFSLGTRCVWIKLGPNWTNDTQRARCRAHA